MHDDKEVAIQILEQPEETVEDKLIVMIKQYHPETWTLDAPMEIWLPKHASLNDFAEAISAKVGLPKERIDCTKISSPWNFHRIMLPFVEWTAIAN